MNTLLNLPCVKRVLEGREEPKKKRNRAEYHREYHLKNSESISKHKARYYQSSKDRIASYGAEYYAKEREKTAIRNRRKRVEKAAIKAAEIKAGTRQLTGRDKAVEERKQNKNKSI